MRRLFVLLCAALVCASCSEPPQKEIDRAQGAIDAARAAGADQYATEPFTAATTALQQSHEAVDQRDYRLALSRALDASERAQEAAKQSADGKAKARGDSEALINAVNIALQELDVRIKTAAAARISAHELTPPRRVAADATAALQKARTAVRAGSYIEAARDVKTSGEQLREQIRVVDDLIAGKAGRPARRKR
jgi:hypothetical protein